MVKVGMILATMVAMAGCYYDNEEELYPTANPNLCDTAAVTFAGDIKPIIDNYCATSNCHVPGGTGNGAFTDYNAVNQKVLNGSLHNRVIVQGNMPPPTSNQLSSCQKSKINAWINAGAPNN